MIVSSASKHTPATTFISVDDFNFPPIFNICGVGYSYLCGRTAVWASGHSLSPPFHLLAIVGFTTFLATTSPHEVKILLKFFALFLETSAVDFLFILVHLFSLLFSLYLYYSKKEEFCQPLLFILYCICCVIFQVLAGFGLIQSASFEFHLRDRQ